MEIFTDLMYYFALLWLFSYLILLATISFCRLSIYAAIGWTCHSIPCVLSLVWWLLCVFLCLWGGGLSSKYFQRGFSIDWGVRQATSHGIGLFMQRRSNFFRLLPSQGPPFFSVTQRCVCAYLAGLTKEGRDPIHFCLWHSPLVFTIFPRRAVCTVEQALSWRSGTMVSSLM